MEDVGRTFCAHSKCCDLGLSLYYLRKEIFVAFRMDWGNIAVCCFLYNQISDSSQCPTNATLCLVNHRDEWNVNQHTLVTGGRTPVSVG